MTPGFGDKTFAIQVLVQRNSNSQGWGIKSVVSFIEEALEM